ncbi:NAD(P)/FAD-dependent oxidoreductase [Allokutzneria oryzae]|uniref:NAD(P)/FAD-dependent oxidoreductase n=1 Tax=Allokutzneria oryzae TaxID=1378989 RepID=A0ABV6A972_9PSEU
MKFVNSAASGAVWVAEVVEMYDVVVVGGGAAGLNAALVLARARRRVLVVDAGEPRNQPAAHMHGFLSRDGMPPGELLAVGREEIARYGAEVRAGRAESVRREGAGFVVGLADGSEVAGHRLVVTTGLRDELPEVEGLRERWGADVAACPYCHGWEVRDQPLGVLGTDPRGAHQALMVRQWSADVVFFGSGLDEPDRAKLLARGIRVVDSDVVKVLVEDDKLVGVELADGSHVARSALFVPTGLSVNDGLLGQLGAEHTADGRTTVPGVYAAGNVVDPMAQVVIAAAQGAKAAMTLNNDLVLAEATLDRRVHGL